MQIIIFLIPHTLSCCSQTAAISCNLYHPESRISLFCVYHLKGEKALLETAPCTHPLVVHWPELWHLPLFQPIAYKRVKSFSEALKQRTEVSSEQGRTVL